MSAGFNGIIDQVSNRWRQQIMNAPSLYGQQIGSAAPTASRSTFSQALAGAPSMSRTPGSASMQAPSLGSAMGMPLPGFGVAGQSIAAPSFSISRSEFNPHFNEMFPEAAGGTGRTNVGGDITSSTAEPRGLDGISQWDEMIKRAADEAGVPWQVVAAIMGIESGGNAGVVSPAGAVGLMQIMPDIWGHVANRYGGDLTNPWTNIRTGAEILKTLYDQTGSWDKAAAAYLGAYDWETGEITSAADAFGTTGFDYVDLFHANLYALGYGNPSPAEYAAGGAPATPGGQAAVEFALSVQGTPYVWGGADLNGFDCSGLVYHALGQQGIDIGRTAEQQYFNTQEVSFSEVRPGDLVFFSFGNVDPRETSYVNHVAIYIGNGQFVHATSNGGMVKIDSLDNEFYRSHILGYGRVPY